MNAWPEVPQIDRDRGQPLPRVNVSIKLSALDSQFDPIDPEGSDAARGAAAAADSAGGAQAACACPCRHGVVSDQGSDAGVFQNVLMEDEFRDLADVGIVIQCYLRDAEAI